MDASLRHSSPFDPSKHGYKALHEVLFPYQVFLLSQSEDDIRCQRTESVILEGYILELLGSSVRIITRVLTRILESDAVPEVMGSLKKTQLGVLLPYLINTLYLGNFSCYITEHLHSGVDELALLWCKLLTICKLNVGMNGLVRDLYEN